MTASRDPERLLRAYLDGGPNELPDRAYAAVRSDIDRTRQRVVIGPWRVPDMNTFAKLAIAAAAVVVVAVVGYNLIPSRGGVAGRAPVSSPSAVPLPGTGQLEAGRYSFVWRDSTVISVSVPAGWTSVGLGVAKHADEAGQVRIDLVPTPINNVYDDACGPAGKLRPVEPGVDALVTALDDQAGSDFSAPVETQLGGRPAKRLDLDIPTAAQGPTCRVADTVQIWADAGETSFFALGPEPLTISIYVVDVDGQRMVFTSGRDGAASTADNAELDAVIASMTIE